MKLGEDAFLELYPEQPLPEITIKYTKAMKGYNANVRYGVNHVRFRLSYEWKSVSKEITKGLLQSLLNKVYKTKHKTLSIDLYNSFLQNVSDYAKVSKNDPILEDSFQRINDQYFNGMLDQPNLIWGSGITKLGHFDYGTNTILISKILTKEPLLLDYVMYHEMLHKKLKFYVSGNTTRHHTKEFKLLESQFHDKDAEKKLQKFVRRKKLLNWF